MIQKYVNIPCSWSKGQPRQCRALAVQLHYQVSSPLFKINLLPQGWSINLTSLGSLIISWQPIQQSLMQPFNPEPAAGSHLPGVERGWGAWSSLGLRPFSPGTCGSHCFTRMSCNYNHVFLRQLLVRAKCVCTNIVRALADILSL